ncbi:YraN family protein [Clostridium vitabionis]|jgi:putative endonuclease|uniref:YraN family protein n=1 Tax=Clostridium vitabionis TaxID=2784388 RepID=UPI00188D6586|nr:YraN family protein [Clostridium vitabionis]
MANEHRGGRRGVGTLWEERAALWLTEKGFRILDRNYYTRRGEIDIVATEGRVLCFVEVKYRRSSGSGDPAEAVTLKKQRRILETAKIWMLVHGFPEETPLRFDVVAILGGNYRLIRDAFRAE